MKRETLFIDTSGWIALIDADDAFHARAASFYRTLPLTVSKVSSSHIISETYTWLRHQSSFEQASLFLKTVGQACENQSLEIVYDDLQLWQSTGFVLAEFPGVKLSHVDALSMAIMRSRGMTRVFGFDQHFRLMGFETVPQ
jgi:predicted nucleic acid-binding protein